jgi:ribosomal protein S18 acetylase RimI-like enzyme
MNEIKIDPFRESDIPEVKKFTDCWIGENYYSEEELSEIYQLSFKDGKCSSLIAKNNENLIVGVRLTYCPGFWHQDARCITPNEWKVTGSKMAYFKSLFIHEDYQKMGIGKKLSNTSLEIIKEMGGEAILCHSWLESPNNSSQIYLKRMGFVDIKTHINYWYPIDYDCTRCSPEKCVCTAIEMVKYLERDN